MKTCYLLLLPLLAACDAAPEQAAKAEAPAVAPVAVAAPDAMRKAAFDVPALLFSRAAMLKKELGKPESEDHLTPLQIKVGAQADLGFVRDTTHILVSCDPKNRGRVNDIFIFFPKPTQDLASLLAAGGLEKDRLRYSLKPVKMLKDPSYYTGVTVTINRNIHP